MRNILRVTDALPQTWPAILGQATTLGFDTLLLPSADIPPAFTEAARGLNIVLFQDVRLDCAPTAALIDAPGPFLQVVSPLTDPRKPPTPAPTAPAAVATTEEARALAKWWAHRLQASRAAGIEGVRLLGLDNLPDWAIPTLLTELREACPSVLLFAWTCGLPWSVLESIPACSVDMVASSLPLWDGRSDWIWRELSLLRRIAPVVADGGTEPDRQALAAIFAEDWLTTPSCKDVETLIEARVSGLAGLPWSNLVASGGGPAYAVLRTDTADQRCARRATLAVTALAPATMHASLALASIDAATRRFASSAGEPLSPSSTITLDPGSLRLYRAAPVSPPGPQSGLSRKRAEQAALVPRLAIEAPSPCVENGRFPARQVIGSEVVVEADIISDGHDHLAAVVRWQAPGSEEWTEVPMALVSNDRWSARFPLEQLGVHQYVVEAWKDVYDTFTDELIKKHAAGVPITLEMQEGTILVRKAAERSRKGLQATLNQILKVLESGDAEERRTVLLASETRVAMTRADDRPHRVSLGPLPVQCERPGAAFASWYEVFPRSMSDDPNRHGTFRDVVRHLPRVQAMGFDVLYFPPIHPIGRINRKGPNNTLTPSDTDPGSPYAIGSAEGGHDALHPELGTLEDFRHLIQAAADHGIELAIDFAVQCAPDHPWLKEHRGWFDWRPDGSIRYAENPPKKYQDIVNVDFYAADAIPDLWIALANAVLFWASQGIRLFRVDNPHTKPLPFWEWMIAEVQARYPESVFLAEAFTRPKVMYRLAKAGFSQSYTYFTWRNTKPEFEAYLSELTQQSPRDFFRPHFFVNTPDINPVPLQTAGRQAFLIRTALATTLSGLWGLYSGFELCEATPLPGREEYLDSEKYQIRAWDWDRPGNIKSEIAALNAIRKRNPALQTHLGVTFLNADNEQVLLFEKATPDRSNVVLVAINMDLHNPQSSRIDIPFWRWTPEPTALEVTDLLQDRHERWSERHRYVTLTAGQPYAMWRLRPATTSSGV